jgi:putative transposase
MPKEYSVDLRKRIVKAVDEGCSVDEAAEMFDVSRRSVYAFLKRRRETGNLEPDLAGRTGRPVILAEHMELLRALTEKHPDATLEELRQKLPVQVSVSTVHNALRREKITLKKNRLPR